MDRVGRYGTFARCVKNTLVKHDLSPAFTLLTRLEHEYNISGQITLVGR
jgi:hypothetical protein